MLREKDKQELLEKYPHIFKKEDFADSHVSVPPPKAPVSRISQAQKIAKGGNLYDRREWSLFIQMMIPIGMVLIVFLGLRFRHIYLYIAVFITGSGIAFITASSTRIVINEYGIHLQRAFSRARQMFYYNEIAKIVFGELDGSYYKEPKPKFEPNKFVGTTLGKRITIFLSNGEYYYFWTEYEHEITRALEKITPQLLIERNLGK